MNEQIKNQGNQSQEHPSSAGELSPRPALARRVLGASLLCLCGGFVVVACGYVLKMLIQARPPEIGVGVFGGILWYWITSKAWQLFKWTLEDAEEAIRKTNYDTANKRTDCGGLNAKRN